MQKTRACYCSNQPFHALFQACKDKGIKLTRGEMLNLLVPVAAGMEFMVAQRFCHRDLAARNCLLHQNNVVKVVCVCMCVCVRAVLCVLCVSVLPSRPGCA